MVEKYLENELMQVKVDQKQYYELQHIHQKDDLIDENGGIE